jgi:ankyrin repeat protein
VIARLLKEAKDVNLRNSFGDSPLHVACQYAAADIVAFLLENYPEIDLDGVNVLGDTPLHVAAVGGRVENFKKSAAIIRMLRKKGAKTTIENGEGETPLAKARANRVDKLVIEALEE